jgi:signal transduction histidine kinase
MESNSQLRQGRPEFRLARNFQPASISPAPTTIPATEAFATQAVDQRLQRLEQLAALGTLSASVAHEIKNAMVAIRTFVEMLLSDNKNAELAEIAHRELVRVDSLISQMLRSAGNPKAVCVRLPLSEILDRSLRLIEPQLRARNIRLERSYLAAPDTLMGDAHQLEQAFLNLFLNACDAIGQEGEISVATLLVSTRSFDAKKSKTANQLQVCIRDTGIGVAKEEASRIFEPFYTTKPNGTGLGLSITREIIERHRGSISLRSEPKKGTVVQVAFPAA